MRSLVTGGAGFIGAHVARRCLEIGHEVVVLDDLSGGFRDNVPDGCELVEGSITDAELVRRVFSQHRFDYVYHLAAYAAEGLSHFIRRFNYTNNVVGSATLINESVRCDVKCFVFTSSIAVYGSGQPPFAEDRQPTPEDPYGIAKYAVEMDLKSAHDLFGLDYVVLRPHNVYGEGQNIADRYRNVVGIFMNQVMQGQPLTIFGDGRQTRAFTHVDDVAPDIARSVHVPDALNQVFNLGGDSWSSVLTVAELVSQAFGVPPRIEFLPARPEAVDAYSRHDKARRVFGTASAIPLEEGIARMARWARQQGARRAMPFKALEISKNLPSSWRESVVEED